MFDTVKEKFNNEPKVKRNVIIVAVALATVVAVTVAVAKVADNDEELGSETNKIVAEAGAQNMGSYKVTVKEGTKIGAEDLLRCAVKKEEGELTQLSLSTELDILSMSDIRVCFDDESLEKKYSKEGIVEEKIVVECETGCYIYDVSVLVVGDDEEASMVTTTTKTGEESKTTTTTTAGDSETTEDEESTTESEEISTSKDEPTEEESKEESHKEDDKPQTEPSKEPESKPDTPKQTEKPKVTTTVTTKAPPKTTTTTVTTKPPVVTEPPVVEEPEENNQGGLPDGNFDFIGSFTLVDSSAGRVYEGHGGNEWALIVDGGDRWLKFNEAWGMCAVRNDDSVSKALTYVRACTVSFVGCDVLFIPSHWTSDDIYNNYGLEMYGSVMHGTYVDKAGDGMYVYIG